MNKIEILKEKSRFKEKEISLLLSSTIHAAIFGIFLIISSRSEKREFTSKDNTIKLISISSNGSNDLLKSKSFRIEEQNGIRIKPTKKINKKTESNSFSKAEKNELNESNENNLGAGDNGADEVFSLGEKSEEKNPYFERIIYLVNKSKRYPRISKINKESGIVKVSFTIEKDGKVVEAKVDCPCGHPRLNEAAVRAITDIGNFDPIPVELNKEKINITIPVRFVLTKN